MPSSHCIDTFCCFPPPLGGLVVQAQQIKLKLTPIPLSQPGDLRFQFEHGHAASNRVEAESVKCEPVLYLLVAAPPATDCSIRRAGGISYSLDKLLSQITA